MKKKFVVNALCVPYFVLVVFLGCSQSNDSYYPLKEGMIWEYQMTSGSMMGGSGGSKIVVTNFTSRELNGKKVTPQKYDVQGQTVFVFMVDDSSGVSIFAKQNPGAIDPEIEKNQNYAIKYPIKVGTAWEDRTETSLLNEKVSITLTSTIERIDEVVTVPAGTFEKCLRVKSIGNTSKNMGIFGVASISVEQYAWYAPGVGTVKSISKEKSNNLMLGGGELTLQLESFKKGK